MVDRVLVLNASFEAINVCSIRRAVVLILKGVASVEEQEHIYIRSTSYSMRAPSVIRLTEYIHIPFERKNLSRKNIFLRDHNRCQYCNKIYPTGELTLDHILPRARGGNNTWDNLVTSCKKCNNRKANRTPEEASMKLLKKPQSFSLNVNRQIIRYLGSTNEDWRKYLYY